MTTAREIQQRFEEGLRRSRVLHDLLHDQWFGPFIDATHRLLMIAVDRANKIEARERYYLRHRLVRLLRRRARQLVVLERYLDDVAAVVVRFLPKGVNTPDRKWFSLRPHPGAQARLFGIGPARPSTDQTVYLWPSRIWSARECADTYGWSKPQSAENYNIIAYDEAAEVNEIDWRYLQKTTTPQGVNLQLATSNVAALLHAMS